MSGAEGLEKGPERGQGAGFEDLRATASKIHTYSSMNPAAIAYDVLDVINSGGRRRGGLEEGDAVPKTACYKHHAQISTLAGRILLLKEPMQAIVSNQSALTTETQALGNLATLVNKAKKITGNNGEKTVVRKLDRILKHHGLAQELDTF